jgi:asparagine synthase (glutamine-hydrolysing)
MSAISGIYNLDGHPVEQTILERMIDIVSHRGSDSIGHWINGDIGISHRALHVTPESIGENQPRYDSNKKLCISFHGRIDNRDDLIQKLDIHPTSSLFTDSEIVLAAYARWGSFSPHKILGDFSFSIFDERTKELFCARDIKGCKPFYYFINKSVFIWGSEAIQLLQHPSVSKTLNEGMVGEYLSSNIRSTEETLFQGVNRLPQAHYLTIVDGKISIKKYWDLNPQHTISYKDENEYSEHFLEILKESVHCRLRIVGSPASELSGGLDSSSVVSLASKFLSAEQNSNKQLKTFSLTFPNMPCDESEYIQEMLRYLPIEPHLLKYTPSKNTLYYDQVKRHMDIPYWPNGTMADSLKSLVKGENVKVLLTGHGGDDWLTGSQYHYADLLKSLSFLKLFRQRFSSRDSEYAAYRRTPQSPIYRYGFRPLVSQYAGEFVRKIKKSTFHPPPWIDINFAEKIDLEKRTNQRQDWKKFSSFAQAHLFCVATSGWAAHSTEMEERYTASFGFEQRHPFYDRRIIEYALALPEEQRWEGDSIKVVLRNAMNDFLPEKIITRKSKAEFSYVVPNAVKALGSKEFFYSLKAYDFGWLNRQEIMRMWSLIEANSDSIESQTAAWRLWLIIGIELMLTEFFNGQQ